MKLPPHKHLDEMGISYESLIFPESTEKGAANVAHALGYTERQMVKTLIFRDNKSGEKVLVMVGGDQNAVSGNLKKAIGSRDISMAADDEVIEATGYKIGSIPPFSWQPEGFRTFIEASLMKEKVLGVGAGVWGNEIMIKPDDLVKASKALIVNLTEKDQPVEVAADVDLKHEPLADKYAERPNTIPSEQESITIESIATKVDQETYVRGWMFNKRSSGGIIFLQLRDGTGFIQGVVEKDKVNESAWSNAEELSIESSCFVKGIVKKEERAPSGYEMQVTDVQIIKLAPEYPLGKKEHGPEFLFDNRDLYVRSKTPWAVLRIRDEVFFSLMQFLRGEGFTRTDTPILQPTSCEDTTELFEIDFYGTPMYLTQSGQLYAEALEHGLGKVYDFGPVFRAEKSKTRKHLSEFWMLDWEIPFYDQEEVEKFTERMMKYVVKSVLEHCQEELRILERDTTAMERVVEKEFVRIQLKDAIALLNKTYPHLNLDPRGDVNAEGEELLSEIFDVPVFVKDYPFEKKAFYMKNYKDADGMERAVCADLIGVEKSGEIGTCAVRNNDYNELLAQLTKRGYPLKDYAWYLGARKYGGVPHAGGGIGPERWIRWISGVHHIRETMPFPRSLVINRP